VPAMVDRAGTAMELCNMKIVDCEILVIQGLEWNKIRRSRPSSLISRSTRYHTILCH
jgi:hypothetical protein